MPEYSLIVLAHNEEKLIEEALKSMRAQAYKDHEIIVVDNNSTDKTGEIAGRHADKVLSEKKISYMNAAVTGARAAKGKYIAFCDADTHYPKNWLLEINKEFSRNRKLVAVYGPARFFDHNPFYNAISGPSHTIFLSFARLFGQHVAPSFNTVMKKEAYEKAGGYDPERYPYVAFDVELAKRLKKTGKMKLKPFNHVHTSARRFKKHGTTATAFMLMEAVFKVFINSKQRVSYDEYNDRHK